MVSKLLGRLFGGGEATSPQEPVSKEDYKGFELLAAPVKDAGRWRVAGSVIKRADGQEQRHDFVRADTFPERDDAVAVTLTKGRLLVDQLGDRVFEQGP